MRAIVGYNTHNRALTLPTVSLHMDPMNSVVANFDAIKERKLYLYNASVKYYHMLYNEWDSDQNILDLMTAIVLFSPNRPKLQHKEVVK
ncbi:unnamed protein product [Oppiella nova]|uniref:Uncharacterized protein n=1 Tax=Oppiella nova TaxID=334625 RepID=A0A7R9QPS5_9ACAR|nr:unnamed protein product [Oppiella nova]CAG2169886.1 unnamed protein product [Oppiella nova]